MVKSLLSAKAVRNRRSPQTTGDDAPGGTATFQRTLSSGPKSVGGLAAAAATPEAFGPRNCGQWASSARVGERAARATRPQSILRMK